MILALRFVLARENKRRDRIQSAMVGGLEGRDKGATAFADLTDRTFGQNVPLGPRSG